MNKFFFSIFSFSLISLFLSVNNSIVYAADICVALYDYNMEVVQVTCEENDSIEEDTTAYYGCIDPDGDCDPNKNKDDNFAFAGEETGPIDPDTLRDRESSNSDSSSSGSTHGGGTPPHSTGGEDNTNNSGAGGDRLWDKFWSAVMEMAGKAKPFCHFCHSGQYDTTLLAQSDHNTFINHEKNYFPNLRLKLAVRQKKYIGKGSYLVQEKRIYIKDRNGKTLMAYPEETIILTDRVGKPTYVYFGIEKGKPIKESSISK